MRQNFSNENDPELLPMFFYDETMGAPEDWRLHKNNKGQRAIDIYLNDDENDFSQMPKSLRLSLLLIHKRVKYNCDNCNRKASEENPVFTICHNSHHLCKQCLMEKITEPKCPCC